MIEGLNYLNELLCNNTYKQSTFFFQKLIQKLNNSKVQRIEFFEKDVDCQDNSFHELLSVDISYNVNQTQYTETTVYQNKNVLKYLKKQSSIVERANNDQDQIMQTLIENQKIEQLIEEEINDDNLEKSLMTTYLLLRGQSKQFLDDNQDEIMMGYQNKIQQKQPKSSQNIKHLNKNICKSGNIKLGKRRNALATESQLLQDTSKLRIIPSCNTNWSNFKIENQNLVQIQNQGQFNRNIQIPEDYIRRQKTHANFQQQFSKEMSNYVTEDESEESSYVQNKSELFSVNSNSTEVIIDKELVVPHNSTQTNFNKIYDTTSYREDEVQRALEYVNYVVQRNLDIQVKNSYQKMKQYIEHQKKQVKQSKIQDLLKVMGQYQNKLKKIQQKIKVEKKKQITQSKIKQEIDYEKFQLCYNLQNITKRKILKNFRLIFRQLNLIIKQFQMNQEDKILVRDYFVEDPSIPLEISNLSLLENQLQTQEFFTKKQKILLSLREENQFYVNTKNWKILLRIICYIFLNIFTLLFYLNRWNHNIIFIALSFVFLQQSFQKLYQEKISDAIQDLCHFALIKVKIIFCMFLLQHFAFNHFSLFHQTIQDKLKIVIAQKWDQLFFMCYKLFIITTNFLNKNGFLFQPDFSLVQQPDFPLLNFSYIFSYLEKFQLCIFVKKRNLL